MSKGLKGKAKAANFELTVVGMNITFHKAHKLFSKSHINLFLKKAQRLEGLTNQCVLGQSIATKCSFSSVSFKT